jgi:murein L,D-transpeptidase YcbB/YkuD
MNLERWRWRSPFPATRIYVNIPEFTLYYYRNDSLIRQHRVVTGAVTTSTPEFEAKLTYLNVYPYWHVPHSITTNEILPVARQDPSYLARNGYTLLDGDGNALDPTAVDLSRGYYRIRQNYGYGNALGVLAFMFPNPHDVFIHDTPLKFFFSTGVRAYSHGCVRLQDPIDLGKEILKADGNKVEPDTLQAMLDRHIPQMIYLQKKIPIFIEYHTAVGTAAGKLLLPLDIYGRDSLTVKMFGK